MLRTSLASTPILIPLIMPITDRHFSREIQLAVAIYQGKLNWGKYNTYRVESAELKKQELDELKANLAAARANAAASTPAPSRTLSTVEWFLLQSQQQQAARPTTCNSFVTGRWITTTCN